MWKKQAEDFSLASGIRSLASGIAGAYDRAEAMGLTAEKHKCAASA
ncbi:hypothetical protein HUG15_00845 [Salicibibacter cibarius]|uniref:Uncharacterized protein n=1 Tax=Salicibibacter cibarius TaxID=2743000 RepID=A0A7T6YZR0_9BACI|nr:hypothetical protein [Salicibibacter cibarius]QQK74305.1 hypothetical protein HUG15_00845 [Salicibibacter cibarius]